MRILNVPKEDWNWLTDVHKVDCTGAVIITLEGNEDAPDCIKVYDKDHYKAIPVRQYEPDSDGEKLENVGPQFSGHAFEPVDYFGLDEIQRRLFAPEALTPDERRDLANKMHVHMHRSTHV